MGSVRLMIVSDSHLSPKTPEATTNWNALVDHAQQIQPDTVVHTGDIALDGASSIDDLRYAREQLDKLGGSTLALPGNHDLGDNPCETTSATDGLITSERLAAYRDYVGEDRWTLDTDRWRLIGLNAQLFGSGLDEEAEQWDWLDQELSAEMAGDKHSALFLHKPLVHSLPHPAEHDVPIRYVRQAARERVLGLIDAVDARVVVSGHVHQYRKAQVQGAEHVWCPTSWATLPESAQATVGERWVGGLVLTLADDGSVVVEPVRTPRIGQHVIGETIPNPYDAH